MTEDNEIAEQAFDFGARDARRWQELGRLCDDHDLNMEYVLKNFPAFLRRRELPRFLAHYELFKISSELPTPT